MSWLRWFYRRRFPRYSMTAVDFVSVDFEPTLKSVRLLDLSQGGCAIASSDSNFNKLNEDSRVECIFYCEKAVRQTILGRLVHKDVIKSSNSNSAILGIEFDRKDQFKLAPIIERLAKLANTQDSLQD